jgi:hypothetical protein
MTINGYTENIFFLLIININANGLAMLSCDNLLLNFLSTKPSVENRRFFQSSTELSN